jgi:hypothetical protein
MSSKATTIYIRDETFARIGETRDRGLSMRIAAMIARYERMCRESMPAFTRDEWCAIMDANNGGSDLFVAEVDGYPSATGIWANLHDSPGLGEKWGVDQPALVKRLQQLSTAELLAVDEAINRFWNHTPLDTDAALHVAWCRIREER